MSALRELSTEECERLLRAGMIGRVAITAPSGPHLVPVNYSVVGDTVVLATTPYSVLGTHGPQAQAVFEIDDVDYERHSGWSVTASGRLRVEQDPEELALIHAQWEPRPWPEGSRSLVLRLDLRAVTGRRVGGGSEAVTPPVQRVVSRA
jgi:nitroimidazol reductase NimA-like FMN-containing flavoprotein (pyridoxamine 5'-phosphate oxidase superfamily)